MAAVVIGSRRTALASLPVFAVTVAICIGQWVPCDSISVREGVALPQVALWLLVALFVMLFDLFGFTRPTSMECSTKDSWQSVSRSWWHESSIFGILIGWMLLATFFVWGNGNVRWAINSLWQWPVVAIVYWLGSRMGYRHGDRAWLIRLLILLSFTVAFHGWYQFSISMPRDRAAYRDAPDLVLAENGIDAPPGSAARMQFESRLESTEPIGPYALTNSLAGFLVSGFLLGVATLATSHRNAWRKPWNWILLGQILCIASCLVLTRSRTAWLAALFGLGGFGVVGASNVTWIWKRRKEIGFGLLAMAIVGLGIIALVDPSMLAEAPMSLAFRWQYWVATWYIMMTYPWFGIGPGNFQSVYPQFKLPLASENIADPHNFLLDVGATGGFPALGLLTLSIGIFIARNLFAPFLSTKVAPHVLQASEIQTPPVDRPILDLTHPSLPFWKNSSAWLALVAMLVAAAMVWVIPGWIGPTPEEIPYVLSICLCAVLWMKHVAATAGTVSSIDECSVRKWQVYLIWIAVSGLIHLSASGGWLAPGSTTHLFLLAGLASSMTRKTAADESVTIPVRRQDRPSMLAASRKTLLPFALLLAISIAFLQTAWYPTLHVRSWQRERPAVKIEDAIASANRAAQADPFDPKPLVALVELHFQEWIASRQKGFATQAIEQRYRLAANRWLASDPKSWEPAMRLGQQALQLATYDPAWLETATGYCLRAVEGNPQEAWGWLQLAIVHFAADQKLQAMEALEKAERLDRETPHFDRRLKPSIVLWPSPFRPPSIKLDEPGLDRDWARGEPAAQNLRKILSTVE